MSIFESFENVKSMLMFYSTMVNNIPDEDEKFMFEQLKTSIHTIDPTFEFKYEFPPTPYEVFTLVCSMDGTSNVSPLLDVEGYDFTPTEYMTWDPDVPTDDTHQLDDLPNIDINNYKHTINEGS
jgi:hypothetical protein